MAKKASAPKKDSLLGSEFWNRMSTQLSSEAECQAFLASLSELVERPKKPLRLNALRGVSLETLQKFGLKNAQPILWESQGFFADFTDMAPLETHPVLGAGLIYLQEAGAMEAVNFLDPQPGERILDLCAAPGGKSTQIGERLKGRGWLVTNDPVRARAERLDLLLARHGILNASIFSQDPTRLVERFGHYFDRILVDAPCSGESLFAKRVEIRRDVRDADVLGCARRQYLILNRASQMLRPGGHLVYSTCTYSREENEDVIQSFLKDHEGWALLREQRRWPHKDGVAGGYVALLRGPDTATEATSFERVFANPEHGNIRHGPFRWDGQIDEYALAMSAVDVASVLQHFSADSLERVPPVCERIGIDLAQARKYLRGEALMAANTPHKGASVVSWENYSLGLVRILSDRMNNLLPKVLRGIN